MTEDALNLPRIDRAPNHLSTYPAVRWLDKDGCVRMGRLLTPPTLGRYGLAVDPRTGNVYMIDRGEYEPNVPKDANGNEVSA